MSGRVAFRTLGPNDPLGDRVIDPPVAEGTYEVARSTFDSVILAHPFVEETNPWHQDTRSS